MFFQNKNAHTGSLFKNSKILKFNDKVAHKNCTRFLSKNSFIRK